MERVALWQATRFRIGKRFLALDVADNILFYYSYNKQRFGGWASVTVMDPSRELDVMSRAGNSLLISGQPMHYKCASLIQQMLKEEVVQRRKLLELHRLKKGSSVAAAARGGEGGQTLQGDEEESPKQVPEEELEAMWSDGFRRRIRSKKLLRLNRFASWGYKTLFLYLVVCAAGAVLLCYAAFKSWLNPPARAGLTNLEDAALMYPRAIGRNIYNSFKVFFDAAEVVVMPLMLPLHATLVVPITMQLQQIRDAAEVKERAAQQAKLDEIKMEREVSRSWWRLAYWAFMVALIILFVL